MMFWTNQSQDGAMVSSTIGHFTAILGIYRPSLAYRDACDYTLELVALIWVCRLSFLEYSLPRYRCDTLVYRWPSRSAYTSHKKRLHAIWRKYMQRGGYSPLSELIEPKVFAKSGGRRECSRATLIWAVDGCSFTIGSYKRIEVSEFCTTYHSNDDDL